MKSTLKKLTFICFFLLFTAGFSSFAHVRSFTDTTIYVRLEKDPDTFHYYDDADYHEVYDFYVRFYSDGLGTVPITLPHRVDVLFQETWKVYNYSSLISTNGWTGNISAYAGDTDIYLYDLYVDIVYGSVETTGNYQVISASSSSYGSNIHYVVIP